MLLDHLVHFEQEGFITESSAHTLLVEAKLSCGDGLALWDLWEVELKLLVVTPLWGELPVVLRCSRKTQANRKYWMNSILFNNMKNCLVSTENIAVLFITHNLIFVPTRFPTSTISCQSLVLNSCLSSKVSFRLQQWMMSGFGSYRNSTQVNHRRLSSMKNVIYT